MSTAGWQVQTATAEDPKARKQEARRRRDAERHPDSQERFKILLEVIDEQRHVVVLEDHRARYAMMLMGGINAVVFIVASRVAADGHLPAPLPWWLVGAGLGYAAATLLFVLAAVDCLRPRSLDGRGLLHWEGIMNHQAGEYQSAWSQVRMDQLNSEAARIAHILARMVQEKYRANHRLYRLLPVLIVLGTVLLAILARFTIMG